MSTQSEFDFEAKPESVKPPTEASAELVERIKKLLRLAADKRGNPHEAEVALQRAYELAEKHRVDVGGLDLDEQTEKIMHERWDMGMRFDRLRRGIVEILATYFHVNVVVSNPKLIVIGKPTDVLLANYVYDFLLRAGRNCLAAYEKSEKSARRRSSSTKRANYLQGFIWGLHSMLANMRENATPTDAQYAIVLAEDAGRKAYETSTFDTRPLKALPSVRSNETASSRGFRDGQSQSINQPLTSSRGTTLLLS